MTLVEVREKLNNESLTDEERAQLEEEDRRLTEETAAALRHDSIWDEVICVCGRVVAIDCKVGKATCQCGEELYY